MVHILYNVLQNMFGDKLVHYNLCIGLSIKQEYKLFKNKNELLRSTFEFII